MSAHYRDPRAAARLLRDRDTSLDTTRDALLFGKDIAKLQEASFCRKVDRTTSFLQLMLMTVVEERASGTRRRILGWPESLNEAERLIKHALKLRGIDVPFPSATSTRDLGARFRYAASLDFTKFFQQFLLITWQFFTFRYEGDVYALATIPTGAVGPPLIGQVLSRALLTLAVRIAHVDESAVATIA
jgi:hypothetical protein